MARPFFLLLCSVCVWSACAFAAPTHHRGPSLAPGETRYDQPHPSISSRADTVWFGGDDGNGIAVQGGVWDFEDNTLQGCFSIDETANPGDYFAWVTADSFSAHGDPVIPMIEVGGQPSVGQIWCGIHEDEADARDFVAGMGYQNAMCQRAYSPEFTVGIDEAPEIEFDFFNHSEPGYDYTYVYLLGFDAIGEVIVEEELVSYDGATGNEEMPWTTPRLDEVVAIPTGVLAEAATFRFEFRMDSDGGWSDQDGMWDSPGGPFAFDDVTITYSGGTETYDFESGPMGWSFERCAGVGAFLHIVDEAEYSEWLDYLGIACRCMLEGKAVGFTGTTDPLGYPALLPGQKETFHTGILARDAWQPPEWNGVIARHDLYANMPQSTGAHYRAGFSFYPYTSPSNPGPHWSRRMGQTQWFYTSSPFCWHTEWDLTTLGGYEGTALPADWDSLRFCFEVYCSCDYFGTPSTVCIEEGYTLGAPVIDNIRIGLHHVPDAPPISYMDGGLFMDGFGQSFPTYLEPSDRGDSNIFFNLALNYNDRNDWLADTTAVTGPLATSEEGRWLAELCFKVARKGARQDLIPEYHAWKARLPGDVEQEFVAVLMDSCMYGTTAWKHRFCSYIHENDPMFDHGYPQQCEENEILPDKVFVPGTRIEYYWRSFWYNGGAVPSEYYFLQDDDHPYEYEMLPSMSIVSSEDFQVQWPAILYIDGYNRGAEKYITAALDFYGLDYDKYDYYGTSASFAPSLKRTYGLGGYNPGGYGNNGCTLEQFIGYRLVLLNSGVFGEGSFEPEDFELFQEWLEFTDCGLGDQRRGLLFNGDQIASIIGFEYSAPQFLHDFLGVERLDICYRAYNEDEAYCVYLEPSMGGVFVPTGPGLSLYGNGCPQQFKFEVLGTASGVAGATGNLSFYSYQQTGYEDYVDFAQIVRENTIPGAANWRTVVDGFSWHHLSERGCAGEDCSKDSACIVAGIMDLLGPQLEWMSDPQDPYIQWRGACYSADAPEENHLAGPVNHLYAARPNPFHASATIRFSLAQRGRVTIEVFDVAGRLKRTVIDGPFDAGEHNLVWDGTDDSGHRAGAGIYWFQMRTENGYTSSRRLIRLR